MGALGFWQEPRQVSASQTQQLAFRLACLEVLPAAAHVSGQGVFCVFFFWGRKHKINVTTPRCLPLSPGFGCCLEMSSNIVPKCLERLRAAHGSHCSCWSWVGSCTAAPGGAGKQTQSLHQAEHSQPLAFRAGKTHYNHLSCKERNPLSTWGARNPDVDFAEANPICEKEKGHESHGTKIEGSSNFCCLQRAPGPVQPLFAVGIAVGKASSAPLLLYLPLVWLASFAQPQRNLSQLLTATQSLIL